MDYFDIQSEDDLSILVALISANVPEYEKFQAMKRYLEIGGDPQYVEELLFNQKISQSLRISLSTLIENNSVLYNFNESVGDPMLKIRNYLKENDPIGNFYKNHGRKLNNAFAFLVSQMSSNSLFDMLQTYHLADNVPNACAQYAIMKINDLILLSSLKFILPPCYQSDIKYHLRRQMK